MKKWDVYCRGEFKRKLAFIEENMVTKKSKFWSRKLVFRKGVDYAFWDKDSMAENNELSVAVITLIV